MPAVLTRLALALLVAAGLAACASDSERAESQAQQIYATAKPPATPLEFVATVKKIVDVNLCLREDFYTEANLRKLFGEWARIQITHYEDDAVRAEVQDFADAGQKPAALSGMAGLSMEAQRELRSPTPSYRLDMTSWTVTKGLDFASVVQALGPDWKEDKDAEVQYLIAMTREYFNPPFPAATGTMGNTIISYKGRTNLFQLRFGPEGILQSAEAFELHPPRKHPH